MLRTPPIIVIDCHRLFGSEDRSHPEWAIISIDFAGAFQRNCSSSDYWQWPVSDGVCAVRISEIMK